MKKLLTLVLALIMVCGMATVASAETELQMWSCFTGDDGATLQALVDQFNTEYAGEIKVTHSPLADQYTNLYLAVQTGTDIPDVLIGHVERIPKMIADGILTDVNYLFEEGAVDLANYPAYVLEYTNIDGYQYGIPWDFNSPVLYINLDLIAEFGLEAILEDGYVTFDEIKTAGEAVAAAGKSDTVKMVNYYGGFNQYVARYEEKGGVALIQDDVLTIDTQVWGDVVAAFQELNTLGYAIAREDDALTMFLSGSLMFYEAGTWTNATLMKVEGLNYTARPYTCFAPETALARCGSHTWMQPDDEERTEEEDLAVATFMDWMGAHSLTWATEAGQVPLYKAVTEMDEFKACAQTFLAEAGLSEHIKIFMYYYWSTFTDAVSKVGNDCLYDANYDIYSVGSTIQTMVDDAIAAGA